MNDERRVYVIREGDQIPVWMAEQFRMLFVQALRSNGGECVIVFTEDLRHVAAMGGIEYAAGRTPLPIADIPGPVRDYDR